MNHTFVILSLLAAIPSQTPSQRDWPQFRGGPAAGVAEEKGLPDSWSKTKNVVWKTEVPGRGWSCPIVWGDKIFLTSVTRDGAAEEPKKGLYIGGERKLPTDIHHWLVFCLDFNSGKILWQKEAHQGKPQSPIHVKNSYASETPVTDGERVYAYFGNVGIFCYDMDGNELWSHKWSAFPTAFGWGTAASPVVHKDRLYIVNDNEKQSFLVALDKKTGKEIWKVSREERSNWATPFVWENEKRTEIITPGRKKIRSYDLDGNVLWELAGMSSITIPTPFSRFGLLYVTSGYVLDNKCRPIYAIRPGASGDITLKEGETSNQFIAWSRKFGGPYNPSPIIYGDYLYVLYDRGMVGCFEARTGKEIYKERIGAGANMFTVSPWAYGDMLFCLSEDGDTFVIQPGPQFKVIGKNSLDEMCMASPAIARKSLLIRTLTSLYRIENATAAALPR
jgi:outer membrane protein assembly factor BamB